MSTHDGHGDAAAAAHAQGDHGFDGEPAREAPADEPRTPGWLPALGAALFVCAGVYLLVSAKDEPAAHAAAAQTAQAAEAQPAQAAAPRPQPQQPQQQAQPMRAPPSFTAHPVAGPGAPGATPHKLDPAEIEKLKKLIQERQQQQGGKPAAAP